MKTQYIYIKLIVVFLALGLYGCESEEDFLESDFNGVTTVGKVEDFSLLLNSTDITGSGSFTGVYPMAVMSDNVTFAVPNLRGLEPALFEAHSWEEYIYPRGTDPSAWTASYKKIFIYNTVLNEIEMASDANEPENIEKVKELKAEALLGRAYEHLLVANLFAQPYSAANASKPGIPYVMHADITIDTPSRETLDDTYSKIEADLLQAITNLPDENFKGNTRGSKMGAYGTLARMYLYKQNYIKVAEYTEKALNINSNYQDYTAPTFFALQTPSANNPDNVYSRAIAVGNLFFNASPSTDLVNLFKLPFPFPSNPGLLGLYDARVNLYFINIGRFVYGTSFFFVDHGISTPELILTRAEALARENQLTEALQLLNDFRKKRIKTILGPFPFPLFSTDKEQVINWVLEERRKEVANKGLRFSDMRRLQLEGRIGTVTHDLGNGNMVTLDEGSPRYTLAIPRTVIDETGMEQNPR